MGAYGSPELYPYKKGPTCPKCGALMSLDINSDRYYCNECSYRSSKAHKKSKGGWIVAFVLLSISLYFVVNGSRKLQEPAPVETTGTQTPAKKTYNRPFPTAAAAPEETTTAVQKDIYRVTADGLHVRDASNTSNVLGTLVKGDQVEKIDDYNDKWFLIEYEGHDAVVFKEYLEPVSVAAADKTVKQTEAVTEAEKTTLASKAKASSGNALVDDRKADLSKIDYTQTGPWSVDYRTYNGYETRTLSLDVFPVGVYEYYKSLPRYGITEWDKILNDPVNAEICKAFAESIGGSASSPFEAAANAVSFVQSLEYIPDGDTEYPKFPIETIYDSGGDCEDTAILLCGFLKSMGYGSALIRFDDHCAVGVLGDNLDGTYFEVNGKRYYYVETTSYGWRIGQIPDEYAQKSAQVIEIR